MSKERVKLKNMNDTFKEIEEFLDTTNKSLSLYQDKINRFEAAINIMEEENISIPEAVFGSLYYYKSKFKKLSKKYRNILGLRNKMKEECPHTDIIQLDHKIGVNYSCYECQRCGTSLFIKDSDKDKYNIIIE